MIPARFPDAGRRIRPEPLRGSGALSSFRTVVRTERLSQQSLTSL